jgi:transcriptional regulator with XRE-family HTH domain
MREYRRETTDERFGANVRILRERAGLSQSALAAGMTERGHPWHQQTVGRVEAGRQSLRAGELEALADILRTSIDRFTWGSAEASETEFVYRAGARLNQRYEAVAEAVTHLIAEGVIAERVTEQHKGSEHERVREACEDVARRAEEYSLQAAIDAGIWRYQERLEEQDRMDKEAADDAQSES